MASRGSPKRTSTYLVSRGIVKPGSLLPSKFQREKTLDTKTMQARSGEISLPRTGPAKDKTEPPPKKEKAHDTKTMQARPGEIRLPKIGPPKGKTETAQEREKTHDLKMKQARPGERALPRIGPPKGMTETEKKREKTHDLKMKQARPGERALPRIGPPKGMTETEKKQVTSSVYQQARIAGLKHMHALAAERNWDKMRRQKYEPQPPQELIPSVPERAEDLEFKMMPSLAGADFSDTDRPRRFRPEDMPFPSWYQSETHVDVKKRMTAFKQCYPPEYKSVNPYKLIPATFMKDMSLDIKPKVNKPIETIMSRTGPSVPKTFHNKKMVPSFFERQMTQDKEPRIGALFFPRIGPAKDKPEPQKRIPFSAFHMEKPLETEMKDTSAEEKTLPRTGPTTDKTKTGKKREKTHDLKMKQARPGETTLPRIGTPKDKPETAETREKTHDLKMKEARAGETTLPRIGTPKDKRETEKKKEKTHDLKMKQARPGKSTLPRIFTPKGMTETQRKPLRIASKPNLYEISPRELSFQHFVANESYEMELSLINKDEVPQVMKVWMDRSPYFQLVNPSDGYLMVAPGKSGTVRIRFTPDEIKDYVHELLCYVGVERVVVPLYGVVTRGILDLPDVLDFSECPPKCSIRKTLLVRNVGNGEARYHMSTESPFSVVPTEGTLGVGDTMEVTVEYYATTTGFHSSCLLVRYDTGEMSQTRLRGEAHNLKIHFSKQCVEFESTFITLSNYTIVAIENHSNITARFQWKRHSTDEEERLLKERLWESRRPKPDEWILAFLEKQKKEDRAVCPDFVALLSDKEKKEFAEVHEEPYLYSDDIFYIEPLEGEIAPNSSAEFKVTFKPKEAKMYHKDAYCSISGRAERMLLTLRGEGRGPWLHPSTFRVQLAKIFINSPHVFEVDLINRGLIEAPFTFVHLDTQMGPCFRSEPEQAVVPAGVTQTVQVFFDSSILGHVDEDLQFNVAGCPTPLIIKVEGDVCPPDIEFSGDNLDYRDVSFGFPKTLSIRLTNKSPGYFKFKLRVTGDGQGHALSSYELITNNADPAWKKGVQHIVEPQEFTMDPCEAFMHPFGYHDIKVTLCSNTIMEYYRQLVVDVEGVGEAVASVPVTARCRVAKLRVYPHILWYEDICYLNEPYEKKFLIMNDTHLFGCYGLLPQRRKEGTPVFYSSRKPCGVVEPYSIAELPVTLESQRVGKRSTRVTIGVFGDERHPLRPILRSSGLYRTIYSDVYPIEFGLVPALTPTPLTLHFVNTGAAPAPFRLQLYRHPHCFVFDPGEGVIPPHDKLAVTITAYLDDTGDFLDDLSLLVGEQGIVTSVPFSAVGIGTTILIDQPFCPEIDLGYQFTLVPCIRRFKVINGGHHYHRLVWNVYLYAGDPEEVEDTQDVSPVTPCEEAGSLPSTDSPKDEEASQDQATASSKGEESSQDRTSTYSWIDEKASQYPFFTSSSSRDEEDSQDLPSTSSPKDEEGSQDQALPSTSSPKDEEASQDQALPSTSSPKDEEGSQDQALPSTSSPKDKEGSQARGLSTTASHPPKRTVPNFKLEPERMALHPGETKDLQLIGFSRIPQVVEDYVLCEGVVGKSRLKEGIVETVIKCKFIDPTVVLSARHFFFKVKKKPSDVLTIQYKPFSVENTCSLPLDLLMQLEMPFMVCTEDYQPVSDGQPVTVDVGQTRHLYVAFDPSYKLDYMSREYEKVLTIDMVRGHPYVEHVTLRGEVHFPNLSFQPSELDFGCVKNASEAVRSLVMTNCSRLPVEYHWSFHVDSQVYRLRFEVYPPDFKPNLSVLEKRACLDCSVSQERHKIRNVEEPVPALKESRNRARQEGILHHFDDEPMVRPYAIEESFVPIGMHAFEYSKDAYYTPLKAEEVFNLVPLSGVLRPRSKQKVSFTFSGLSNTVFNIMALCHVAGGPTYKVKITGESQRVSYSLSMKEIDCSLQIFNEVHHEKVTLTNVGLTAFNWVLNSHPSSATENQHLPGVFLVRPTTGFIGAGGKQVLKFSYLPGVPGPFSRIFQIKIGDLDPAEICLKGTGTFPRISVNLPWYIKGNEKFEKLLKLATKRQMKTRSLKPPVDDSGIVTDTRLQVKMERLLIQELALELQRILVAESPNNRFPDKEVCQSLVDIQLPHYVLDMGNIIEGFIEKRVLRIANTGLIPVSFEVKARFLIDTGFKVDLAREEWLPTDTTKTFEVCFESAHRPLGDADAMLPIWVTKGIRYYIQLHATVVPRLLILSKNRMHFSETFVGQCQVEVVRLYNWLRAPCNFFVTVASRYDQLYKTMTPAVRQMKIQAVEEACPFKVIPSKAVVMPGTWRDLQVQFAPKEEKSYTNELVLNIRRGSKHLKLHVSGQGVEPRLEFSPKALKMGWVQVCGRGVEATVVVKNPCEFPVEFYSLDYDEQYLQEEKILRMVRRAHSSKTFWLPPRGVGETLPPELLEYYEAWKRMKAGQAEAKARAEAEASDSTEAEAKAKAKAAAAPRKSIVSDQELMPEMFKYPVTRALERYMGPDRSVRCVSPERRGIIVIVHGAPRTGKTAVAERLADYYGASCFSIDDIVKDTIAYNESPPGLRARDLCIEADMKLQAKQKGNVGKKPPAKKDQAKKDQAKKDQGKKSQGKKGQAKEDQGKKGQGKKDQAKKDQGKKGQAKEDQAKKDQGKKGQAKEDQAKKDQGKKGQGKKDQALGQKNNQKNAKRQTSPAQKKKSQKEEPKIAVATSPAPQKLSLVTNKGEELNCLSCVLPEDLLVNIISDRLQMCDCYKGIIIDSLESLFTSNLESSLLCLLKAASNHPRIFIVNLHQDYDAVKAREKAEVQRREAERVQKVRQWKKVVRKAVDRLLKVDEEQYDALPVNEKALLDRVLEKRKRKWWKRQLERMAQRLKEKRRAEKKAKQLAEKLKEKQLAQKLKEQEERAQRRKKQELAERLKAQALKEAEKKDELGEEEEDELGEEEEEDELGSEEEEYETEDDEDETEEDDEDELGEEEEEEETEEDDEDETEDDDDEDETEEDDEDETEEDDEDETEEDDEDETEEDDEDETEEDEEKDVSLVEKPAEPQKRETKPPEKKETKPPEKKETKPPEQKETKPPEQKETKPPEKKETKPPEKKETKPPEKKETKPLEKKETKPPEKKETKIPEKETKPPEEKKTKSSEKKETEPPEKKKTKSPEKKTEPQEKKASKSPEGKHSKSPEKKETKSREKKETEPQEKKASKSPEGKHSKSPEKKETKSREKKETEPQEKKASKSPEGKHSKSPEKKETKSQEKKETEPQEKKASKSPERKHSKSPEKKETKSREKKETEPQEKKASKSPEGKHSKSPEKKETKSREKKETEPQEKKASKSPEGKHSKSPEKKETKSREKKETEPQEKKASKSPEKKPSKSPEKKETRSTEKETKSTEKKTKSQEKKTKSPEKKGKTKKGKNKIQKKKKIKIARELKIRLRKELKIKLQKELNMKIGKELLNKFLKNLKLKIRKKPKIKIRMEEEIKIPKKEVTIPRDIRAEMEKNLMERFQIYESSRHNVRQVFSHWDRVQGIVQVPANQSEDKTPSPPKFKGQKNTVKPQEKVEKSVGKHESHSNLKSSHLEKHRKGAEARAHHVGVPCVNVRVTNPEDMMRRILASGKLPAAEKLLPSLGIYPFGAPFPPTATFSLVEYPEKRWDCAWLAKPFTIIAPEGAAAADSLAETPDAKDSSAKGQPETSKEKSPQEGQISTQSTGSPWDISGAKPKRFSEAKKSTPQSASASTEPPRWKQCRWIVPPHGEVKLTVLFHTTKPGLFKRVLMFEVMGSKRQYKLPCYGTGLYPSISDDPRLVFPQWRKTMKDDEIIVREYVESTKLFHFGPLLCGKSREWYKAQNCTGNVEKITILNSSPMDVEVDFSFEDDEEAETFLLDPPSMALKPDEKQELTIWAYPTDVGFLKDRLICCIKNNPEPVVFGLCCQGVHVKLEISPQEVYFDKLLLNRTDSRTLILKNDTLLPVAWQLHGLDDLDDDFSLSQDNGIIDPVSEFEVTLSFRAGKTGNIEKTLRLEVSDTEDMLGIVQTETVEIYAEVYDVALSIDMPEGPDGSLDFGIINVPESVKKVLTLKNKGMYNIEYSFKLRGVGPRLRNVASYFTVEPKSGMLMTSQAAVNIEMVFHPTTEIFLKNKPILYCQVTDASMGEGGRVAANIPVRVSAKAVYSKYSLAPASPIDFGSMIKGTRKTQVVMLENKGLLPFKFCVYQAPKEAPSLETSKEDESAPSSRKRSAGGKPSFASTQGQNHFGMFTVFPSSGSIAPWGQLKINVECLAGEEGTCEERLYIDITGKDPSGDPFGIPFTLIAESCYPGFVDDVLTIFEEYPVCSSTDLTHKQQSVKSKGLFVRDENKFIFNKIVIGQKVKANFKIYNASTLPCEVVLSIKPLPGLDKSPIDDIFNLNTLKLSIPGSSYGVATVTFTPQKEQDYNCTFRASLVIPKSPVKIKPQILTFTISGMGLEPQLEVVCPSGCSQRGNPVLRFKRLELGESETLPVVVRNNTDTGVEFMLHLEDEYGAFLLKGKQETLECFHTPSDEEDSSEEETPKKPFLFLHRGQSVALDVTFKPALAQYLEGRIRLLLGDTYSDKIEIELVGEGHCDRVSLDGLEEDEEERTAKSSLKKDIIDAVRVNHLQFGLCPVGKYCRQTFTMTSHYTTKVMRFEWETDAPFEISPRMGHLRPGCAKVITVTLKSDVPAIFRRHLAKCKVDRIKYPLPKRKVPDWDDGMQIVTWVDTTRKEPEATWPEKDKVVEIAPEPVHEMLEGNSQEDEVYFSAHVAYVQLKVDLRVIQFKDTVPYQTRTANFSIHNTGTVPLQYHWVEDMDEATVKRVKPYSRAPMRKFLCSPALRHRKKLVRRFWRRQERLRLRQLGLLVKKTEEPPPPDGEQQPQDGEQQPQDGEQQQQDSQQQQPSDQQQQPAEGEQQQTSEGEQQQSSEGEQQEQPEEEQQQQPEEKKKKRRKRRRFSQERIGTSMEIFPEDVDEEMPVLFTLDPERGCIEPGQKQTFVVTFTPTCAGKFKTIIRCRIPNLDPTQKKVRLTVKGRVRKQKPPPAPLRSALRQPGSPPRPKKTVHWESTSELDFVAESSSTPSFAADDLSSADDGLSLSDLSSDVSTPQ